MIILKAIDTHMHFGGVKAVDGLSMEVEKGQILGIIGPNGSGKTSFFNVLTGAYKATSGAIVFNDTNITGFPPYRIASLGMSRTFQNIRLFQSLSVEDNILMGMHHHLKYNLGDAFIKSRRNVRTETEAREKVKDCLNFVGLIEKLDEFAINLSYGEQRKVELARALASEPKLLLLDELTAGMNAVEAVSIMKLIKEIQKTGITVILIEHNMKVMMETAEWIIAMDAGKEIARGFPSAIQTNPLVIEAYLGKGE